MSFQTVFLRVCSQARPGGGGGGTRLRMGRGVPLGCQNLTLSQTARRTKNTPCHNIPYYKLSNAYPVAILHTPDIPCAKSARAGRTTSMHATLQRCVHAKIWTCHKHCGRPTRTVEFSGPVINIVAVHCGLTSAPTRHRVYSLS